MMNVSLPSTTKRQNILAFFTWNYLDPFKDKHLFSDSSL